MADHTQQEPPPPTETTPLIKAHPVSVSLASSKGSSPTRPARRSLTAPCLFAPDIAKDVSLRRLKMESMNTAEARAGVTEFGERYMPYEYPSRHKYRWVEIPDILLLAIRWHWICMVFTMISALLNWHLGMSDKEIFHPLVFKSMFVVFGFMLGFRNVAANRRSESANNAMQDLFTKVWTVILLFPNSKQRQRISKAFVFALKELSMYITEVSKREHLWHAALDVKPASSRGGGIWGGSSSRPLLQNALAQAESELYDLEENVYQQTRRRILWPHVAPVMEAYDNIIQLCMPAVTDRYAALIDTLLFIFMCLLPWGITIKPMNFGTIHGVHVKFGSGMLNVSTSMLIAFIMLGLNALAQENEDPFGERAEHIPIRRAVDLFEHALDCYEVRRHQVCHCQSEVLRSLKPWQVEVFISAALSNIDDLQDEELARSLCNELGLGQL